MNSKEEDELDKYLEKQTSQKHSTLYLSFIDKIFSLFMICLESTFFQNLLKHFYLVPKA